MLENRPRSPLLPRLYLALLLMATAPYSQPSFCNGALHWRSNNIEYCFAITALDSAPGEGNCGRCHYGRPCAALILYFGREFLDNGTRNFTYN